MKKNSDSAKKIVTESDFRHIDHTERLCYYFSLCNSENSDLSNKYERQQGSHENNQPEKP